jgi:hypothetical protein
MLLRGVRFREVDLRTIGPSFTDALRNTAIAWRKRVPTLSDVWFRAIDITMTLLTEDLSDLLSSLKKQIAKTRN